MVFFNYATMQMAAKIVYYGPGLCGKTTNLHHIYQKTSPQSRGEMVSLETETDRTLFFDLLPIDVGVIGGFKTRLQLYTVPGQVFYNTTRKLVLKGVDGIVFVADSQRAMLEANVESIKNLRENLGEIGTNLDEIPLVIQLNKRDLPNIADPDTIMRALDPDGRAEHVEAVAFSGTGVFETLKLISKLTLRTLRRRMTGEEPAAKATSAAGRMQFRVQDSSRTMAGSTPVPSPAPASAPSYTSVVSSIAAAAEEEIEALPASTALDEAPVGDETIAVGFDRRVIADAPVADAPSAAAPVADAPIAEPPVAETPAVETAVAEAPETPAAETLTTETPAPEAPAVATAQVAPEETPAAAMTLDDVVASIRTPETVPTAIAEPEIDFSQSDKPQKAEPEVKTVKVRNSVDVMAELEALRKRATNTTPRAPRRDILADLASLRPRRDISRTLHIQLPADVFSRAKSVRVTLSFEDGEQGVIDARDQQVELGDTSDVQSLSVNLKIDPA
jgi:mutual gliding-motility protein MglA